MSLDVPSLPAPRPLRVDSRVAKLRRIAVIPALNEEDSIAGVIAEVHVADPGFEEVQLADLPTEATLLIGHQDAFQEHFRFPRRD